MLLSFARQSCLFSSKVQSQKLILTIHYACMTYSALCNVRFVITFKIKRILLVRTKKSLGGMKSSQNVFWFVFSIPSRGPLRIMGGGGGVSFGGGGGSNGQVSSDKENHTPGGGGGGSDSDSDDGPILYRGPGDVVMLPQMDDEELEEEGKRGEC